MIQFSVLIPVYGKADAEQFDGALQSVWDKQVVKPAEIVIVEDGPLSADLYKVIDDWKEKTIDRIVVVKLKTNLGLGKALQAGLVACKFDIVARMDADDLSLPNRFEIQTNYLKENEDISLVGSFVEEFFHENESSCQIKRVPTTHLDIISFSKFRNPFNHPTVMFRKKAILEAGGYQENHYFEDYDLWVRMILKGFTLSNLNVVLVKMRSDYDQTSRRGGLIYFIREAQFHYKLVALRHISILQLFRNIIFRLPLRVMPVVLRSNIYQFFRKF